MLLHSSHLCNWLRLNTIDARKFNQCLHTKTVLALRLRYNRLLFTCDTGCSLLPTCFLIFRFCIMFCPWEEAAFPPTPPYFRPVMAAPLPPNAGGSGFLPPVTFRGGIMLEFCFHYFFHILCVSELMMGESLN